MPLRNVCSGLILTGLLFGSFSFKADAQTNLCDPPTEPTFTVTLPKLGTPPNEPNLPAVWEHFPDATNDSITVPNGRPIYALIVSGYASNRYLDELMVYDFARYLMEQGAYVHYAWWNNLLAPYMERPLHHNQCHPGALFKNLGNFTTAAAASKKAAPGEDYQFVEDAKLFLSAIRSNNPSAIIVVVGHSMGGGAVVHLASQTDVLIDLLAPIDAVGNRNYPWAGPAAQTGPVANVKQYANWTRWRVTRNNFRGFRSANFEFGTGCQASGPWLKNVKDIYNDLRCGSRRKVLFYDDDAPTLTFGTNVINLHYRYQQEAKFPFDYDKGYHFGHDTPSGGSTSQAAVEMTPAFSGFPPKRCPDPGGWPAGADGKDVQQSPCCMTGAGVGWDEDGHGEIVGYRGPIPTAPLGVKVRTSPHCGNCADGWPARSFKNGKWSNGDGSNRVALLQALETLPAGTNWTHRPLNPDLCLVSAGLIKKFKEMNKPPTANAGPDQVVTCGAQVQLDGSASSDPDGDPLTYHWTWDSGSAQGVSPTITLPAGVHCITLTVQDLVGHVATDVTSVEVQGGGTEPPALTVCLTPRLLWPPDHTMRYLQAAVEAHDACGNPANVALVSITSNEPDNGPGDGNTDSDILDAEFNTLDLSFRLRAERNGRGRGRIYTITYRATDDAGNSSTASEHVIVPHDMSWHR